MEVYEVPGSPHRPAEGWPPPPQATCNLLRRLQPSQSITKENSGSTPSMMNTMLLHVGCALTSFFAITEVALGL